MARPSHIKAIPEPDMRHPEYRTLKALITAVSILQGTLRRDMELDRAVTFRDITENPSTVFSNVGYLTESPNFSLVDRVGWQLNNTGFSYIFHQLNVSAAEFIDRVQSLDYSPTTYTGVKFTPAEPAEFWPGAVVDRRLDARGVIKATEYADSTAVDTAYSAMGLTIEEADVVNIAGALHVRKAGAWVAGSGTVTNVAVVAANGVSAAITDPTTTPSITFTLGDITPSKVNDVVISGTATPTLAVTGTTAVSGTNTGDDKTGVTGVLKGDGSDVTAAVPGTDYAPPLAEYTYSTLPSAASNSGLHVWVTDVGINGGSEWRSDGVNWFPVGGEVILYHKPGFMVMSNSGNIVAGSVNTITQAAAWTGAGTGNEPKYLEMYLPAVASTPAIVAGWYTIETTGLTTGTILSGGVGSAPITFTVGAAFTGHTARTTFHSCTLPAGLFTEGCQIQIAPHIGMAGSTITRSVYMSIGGADCYSETYTSASYITIYNMMYKILAESIDHQSTFNAVQPDQLTAGPTHTNVDMSVSRVLTFDGSKANGVRMITAGFSVRLIK